MDESMRRFPALDPEQKARLLELGSLLMEQGYRVYEPVRHAVESWSGAVDWAAMAAAGDVLRTAASVARPWNLHAISPADMNAVAALATEDGIPVAWVPGTALVKELIAATPASARLPLLVGHTGEILDDCVHILDDREIKTRFAARCREAIAAHRAGHTAAAQSHATNVIDSLVIEIFDDDRDHRRKAKEKVKVEWSATTLGDMSAHLALRPLEKAFVPWWARQGRPTPVTYSRHVTAHSAGEPDAFTDATALVAVMLATSLTVEFAPNSGVDEPRS